VDANPVVGAVDPVAVTPVPVAVMPVELVGGCG
jgi:hypothetical protein